MSTPRPIGDRRGTMLRPTRPLARRLTVRSTGRERLEPDESGRASGPRSRIPSRAWQLRSSETPRPLRGPDGRCVHFLRARQAAHLERERGRPFVERCRRRPSMTRPFRGGTCRRGVARDLTAPPSGVVEQGRPSAVRRSGRPTVAALRRHPGRRPAMHSSAPTAGPTIRGRRCVPPAPGITPTVTSGWPTCAAVIEQFLGSRDRTFDDLVVPFTAVAMDVATGRRPPDPPRPAPAGPPRQRRRPRRLPTGRPRRAPPLRRRHRRQRPHAHRRRHGGPLTRGPRLRLSQSATDPRRDLRRDHALHRSGRHAHPSRLRGASRSPRTSPSSTSRDPPRGQSPRSTSRTPTS